MGRGLRGGRIGVTETRGKASERVGGLGFRVRSPRHDGVIAKG